MAGHAAVGDTAHAHLVPHLDILHILARLCRIGLRKMLVLMCKYISLDKAISFIAKTICRKSEKNIPRMKLRGLSPVS
jgi:hypothetical protein